MKLSDYIIMSDVDGTLLSHEGHIPQRNIDALKRFAAKGGRFGIATGRAKEVIGDFVKVLPVNAPCVIHNGGGIYDYAQGKYLLETFLPDSAKAAVKSICKEFPDSSALVIAGEHYYQIQSGGPLPKLSEAHSKVLRYAEIDKIVPAWYKVVFWLEESRVDAFNQYVADANFADVRFVYTSKIMPELLPAGSSKGDALQRMERLGFLKRECLAAVGDFYNDIEMLEFAAVGAATAEAPDAVKAKAKIVTGPCDGGAVADLVEYLERIAD